MTICKKALRLICLESHPVSILCRDEILISVSK